MLIVLPQVLHRRYLANDGTVFVHHRAARRSAVVLIATAFSDLICARETCLVEVLNVGLFER